VIGDKSLQAILEQAKFAWLVADYQDELGKFYQVNC
jgi:hypothetical protein